MGEQRLGAMGRAECRAPVLGILKCVIARRPAGPTLLLVSGGVFCHCQRAAPVIGVGANSGPNC